MKTQRILNRDIELLKAECKEQLMFLTTRYHEIYLYQTLDYIPKEERRKQIKIIDALVSDYIKFIPSKYKNELIECAQYLGSSRQLTGHRSRELENFNLFELTDAMKASLDAIDKKYV